MTCRTEVVAAFEGLHRETKRRDFAPVEILRQVRATGSSYADSTVRTHVVSHMVADGTLMKVGPAWYRLAIHRHHPPDPTPDQAPTAAAGERTTEDEVPSRPTSKPTAGP